MQFKPSAGIFVAGIATTIGGALLFLMVATGDGEGMGLAMIGLGASVAGVVMLCVGAARALAIIDALPAAFRNLDRSQQPNQQFPQQQPYSQPQAYEQQPHYEQQPPVQ